MADNVGKADDETSQGRAAQRLVFYAAKKLKAEYGVDVLNDVLVTKKGASPAAVRRHLDSLVHKTTANHDTDRWHWGSPESPTPNTATDGWHWGSGAPPAPDTKTERYYVVFRTYSNDQLEVAGHERTAFAESAEKNLGIKTWSFSVLEMAPESTLTKDAGDLALVLGRRSNCRWTKEEANDLSTELHDENGPNFVSATMTTNPTVHRSADGIVWKLILPDPAADRSCQS